MDKQRRSARGMAAVILLAACAFLLVLSAAETHKEKHAERFSSRSLPPVQAETIALPRGPVDPNHGSLAQIMELPGVGKVIGQLILDEREAGGPYYYPEDMLAVRGIGPATLEKMRDMLKLTESE